MSGLEWKPGGSTLVQRAIAGAAADHIPASGLPKDGIAIGYDGTGSRIVLILAGPHRGEVWFLDTLNPDDDADVHGDWFRRSDVLRLAGSFRDFVDSLGPRQADAGATASR